VRVWGTNRKQRGLSGWWIDFVPGGIAVAVGKSLLFPRFDYSLTSR
jgi:hypothetical protein